MQGGTVEYQMEIQIVQVPEISFTPVLVDIFFKSYTQLAWSENKIGFYSESSKQLLLPFFPAPSRKLYTLNFDLNSFWFSKSENGIFPPVFKFKHAIKTLCSLHFPFVSYLLNGN